MLETSKRNLAPLTLLLSACFPAVAAEPVTPAGAVVLLDFEDDSQIARLRLGAHTAVETAAEAAGEGKRAAKIVYSAVPEGSRDYPAVVIEKEALRVRDFTPFEALSLRVKNPGPDDAELSLSIWDEDGNRSFPIPSTVTIGPGKWQQVVSRLVLHGVDARRIGSVHLYQKVSRRPHTLLLDEVQLLSPQAGRFAARIKSARESLAGARAGARALGAESQIEPKIASLSRSLDDLEDPSKPLNQPSRRMQRLLELARITSRSEELAGSISIRNEGKSLTLSGAEVEAGWLSHAEKVRPFTELRLLGTPLGDEVFSFLEPARDLKTLIVSGKGITGAGLEKLSGSKLAALVFGNTGARDDSLKHLLKFDRLEEIHLDETAVTGGVLEHLAGHQRLKVLRLSGTGVSDEGFAGIARLTSLESLDLDRTRITGRSLLHLAGLNRLKSLDLRDTAVDDAGLGHLSGLVRLESLLLEDTPLTGAGFGRLEALDNLVSLNLNRTRVGDSALRQLGDLPKLKRLELSSTRITDGTLEQVARSARLEYLDLYGTSITDSGLAHLRDQRGLNELYLGGTRTSDRGAGSLENLTRLDRLDLTGTQVTDGALKHLRGMTNLSTLKLGNTRISGAGLIHLQGLSKLRVLDLSGTGATDEAVAFIGKLPSLRTLRLGGTRVSSAGLRSLQAAGKLVELDLEATEVEDGGLELLASLPGLQVLDLDETAITDQGLKHLKRLEKLHTLSLNRTRITDEGLSYLGERYSALELAHTRVTDRGVERLQRNDQLSHLRLASTGISSDALKALQAMPNLRRLDLGETNVDDAGLRHLAVLPYLEDLDLHGTAISDMGIDSLLSLRGLKRLSLENARITSQGASYLKLRSPALELELVFPWVWGERWTYYAAPRGEGRSAPSASSPGLPPRLKSLSALRSLHADETFLTPGVLRSLKDLPALEHLSFKDAPLTDAMLAELLGLSRVARLDLSGTAITDAGLIHLKDMQGVRELSLEGAAITGEGLVHLAPMARLQALSLKDTPLGDRGLQHLAGLEQLRTLELGGTSLTDEGIAHLSRLPRLEYLDLYGTGVTDRGLAGLGRMSSLRFLYLTDTALTDAGIGHLGRLTGLEELGLDGTELTDRGLAVLRPLSNLRRLRIGRTRVTGGGLAPLGGFPNLTRLELDHLPLTDAGLAALKPLSRLRSLDLSGTRITDAGFLALPGPGLAELEVRDTAVTADAVARLRERHPGLRVASGATVSGYPAWSLCITAIYGAVALAICFYGFHRYWLAWLFLRDKGARMPIEPLGRFAELPPVTVQLPMFNERHVAGRIIEAACAFDYPGDRLQIQVLDDSTDESAAIARDSCRRMAEAGHDIRYIHRPEREGFKGGALAAGLKSARGEFIAVFDADFVPPPDILHRTIHHFTDLKTGMVQAEWSHLNRGESLLTECQAMFLDGHFVVEQTTRSRNNRWFNFNGTAGVWRKSCIEDAGGWQHDTLTEDTDLSYRAQLRGWRFLYLPAVRCSGELPSTMTAFLGQQHRWTKGLIQTGKKLLPRILGSPAPLAVKLEAWFHLTSPVMYLVMFILTGIAFPAFFLATPLTQREGLAMSLGLGTLLMGTIAAVTFYVLAQRAQGFPLRRTLLRLPALMALGIGMCAVNARAVLEALFGLRSPFVRTPKFGGRVDCEPDPTTSRRRPGAPAGILELVMGGLLFACLVMSLSRPYTLIGAPFLLLFALGYSGVGVLCLLDRSGGPRRQSRALPARRLRVSPARFALGALAVLVVASVSGSILVATSRAGILGGDGPRRPVLLGLDLATAGWGIAGGGQPPGGSRSAVKGVLADRGSLELDLQLDERTDQGEIVLELAGALEPLGKSMGSGRRLEFEFEVPSRFTGELQAFVKDGQGRSEYGSMEFIESHDPRRAVTVSLHPTRRVPPMGYQDQGFDPARGIREIGLKISAQSDRVRGSGYRPFRGAVRVARARISDVDPDADPGPEVLPPARDRLEPLRAASREEFLAGSGVDRPWPMGYGFSGPLREDHREELERTYLSIARLGCAFTRVYLGDYRTGLVLDGGGLVAGVEPAFLEYVDGLAAAANRHGITVMVSLTDNTMADGRGLESVELIRAGEQSDSFVENALAELVRKLKGRRVIWDIFNEPENVTALPLREIQRYVGRVLAAGRRADGGARFTVVSRSRPDIVYWQGRGLDLHSHNIFTGKSLEEALAGAPALDAPLMVAEMAPLLATPSSLEALRRAGYRGAGIWGWGTDDRYEWDAGDLERIAGPLMKIAVSRR